MSNILQQRRILTKRCFEITHNSLKFSVKRPFKYYEEELSFGEIGKKVFKKKSFNRFAITGIFISSFGLIATLVGNLSGDKTIKFEDIFFYVLLTAIVLALLLFTRTNTTNLMLVDKRYVAFYSNSPDNETVKRFIDLIFSDQKKYMLNKYAKREQFLPLERLMEQIVWLKDRNIIDEPEFEKLKTDLFPITSNSSAIGFTFNSNSN